jgi:hypothetical protein
VAISTLGASETVTLQVADAEGDGAPKSSANKTLSPRAPPGAAASSLNVSCSVGDYVATMLVTISIEA